MNYALENLRVEHELQCRIADPDGQVRSGCFTILQCMSDDHGIQEYFLRTMEMMTASLPVDAGIVQISDAVERLIALFQAMHRAPSRTVQGLWAEMFLIVNARDPLVVLKAWHADINERIDFNAGCQRLEVKCPGDRSRRHFFSWEQVNPPPGSVVLVASVFVDAASGGTTLGELWEQVRAIAGANADLRFKVEQVCLETLGQGWQDALYRAYDAQRASQSLAFFDVADIPRIDGELPAGVFEVRFRSDLSIADPVDPARYRGGGALFDALLGGFL